MKMGCLISNSNMEATDVIALYEQLRMHNIVVWLDGGWGVDALLGHQTRPHQDLDIAMQEKDVQRFRAIVENNGYREIKLDIARPYNFVLGDGAGHEIDVHVIVLDAQGDGIYGPIENGEIYPAESLTGMGTIAGEAVNCTSPEWAVKFHRGYELKEKDRKDVAALCEKFGIDLPGEFLKSKER
jgi:lincosamide nucleotidyltransferase A/C/D/E